MTTDPDPDRLHPRELAYLGDAVFELHVREQLLGAELRSSDRHRMAVARVRAEAQAAALAAVEPALSESERDLVRRARNLKVSTPRSVDQDTYRLATALEALVGYLHASGRTERLAQIFALADRAVPEGAVSGREGAMPARPAAGARKRRSAASMDERRDHGSERQE